MLLVSTNFACTSLAPLYVPSTLSSIGNYIEEPDGKTAKGHRYSASGVPRCTFSWKKTSHLFDPATWLGAGDMGSLSTLTPVCHKPARPGHSVHGAGWAGPGYDSSITPVAAFA
ncbi:hypothetical protein J3E69DRAFT_75988 [Trichoderma sp. SZMC 28015]